MRAMEREPYHRLALRIDLDFAALSVDEIYHLALTRIQ